LEELVGKDIVEGDRYYHRGYRWGCWCGRMYKLKNGHYANRHVEEHKSCEDGHALPGGSRHKEYRSWPILMVLVLNRDGNKCVACGKPQKEIRYETEYEGLHGDFTYSWSKTNLEVHHIIARKYGGTDHPTNLISLCLECHNKTKQG